MTCLLLFLARSAHAYDQELTNYELAGFNRRVVALDEFRDNEFIYQEKLAAVEKDLEQNIDRKVKLLVSVKSVSKTAVSVVFFTNVDPKHQRLPVVWLVSDTEYEKLSVADKSYVGRGRSKFFGTIKIGGPMPIDLAKTLRREDRLVIEGTLHQIDMVKAEPFADPLSAQLVIVAESITKELRQLQSP